MVAISGLGPFLGGLALGIVFGLVLAPVFHFWLAWSEWTDASREARLTEDLLERMDTTP